MSFKTVIIEDEPLALKRLLRILQAYKEDVTVIGQARDGQQAVDIINRLKPDLVFLDIQIPELNGFEVLSAIDHSPFIIFTTAYDHYAIKAFDVNSIDYLLKPVESERLAKSLDKLKDRTENSRYYKEEISNLIRTYSKEWISKFPVKVGNKIKYIDVENIAYLKASDKYVELFTIDNDNFLLNDSLVSLEEKLNSQKFRRIHRSFIVNTDFIDEISKGMDGKLKIKLKILKTVRLPLSRSYKDNLDRI